MKAAAHLAQKAGLLPAAEAERILAAIDGYGPIPSLEGVRAERLVSRLASDKKTLQGKVHFVLPERIGQVKIATGFDELALLVAARAALG
jgi:3-dehydroquinate synthase